MNKLKKGDNVVVLTGRDKGKTGVITARVDNDFLLVDGVNRVKKHQKPNPMKNQIGGIVEKVMPIHQSNVAIFNATTGKSDRVQIKLLANGVRTRIYKSTGEEIKI